MTPAWIVTGLVLLNCYTFGANCVERFVNYQTWPYIPRHAFRAYHHAQQPLIQIFVVTPLLLSLILQIMFVLRAQQGLLRMLGWTMLAATVLGFVSTVSLQLPIHRTFEKDGYSPALMRRLLRTDWLRKSMDAVRLSATVVLLHALLASK